MRRLRNSRAQIPGRRAATLPGLPVLCIRGFCLQNSDSILSAYFLSPTQLLQLQLNYLTSFLIFDELPLLVISPVLPQRSLTVGLGLD
jgi:hypothetical protein